MANFRQKRARHAVISAAVFAVLSLAVLAVPAARAETHSVEVRSNAFAPNELTVQAGDTVRWVYAPPGGNCGPYGDCGGGEDEPPAHTVTADDGLFTSGAPSGGFVFEHTFGETGEFRYHCAQHSVPGLDIQANMNGRIVVESSHNEPGFAINAGLNDAWFNPLTSGQGFFITVFPDLGQMFVAWFTFDVERPDESVTAQLGEPGHRWITAFGPYAGAEAVLDIEITSGGVFDSAQPSPEQNEDGTLTLEFSGCNAARVTYDIPSLALQGEVPIQRLANDNLDVCQAAAGI